MKVTLISAMDPKGVMGKDGGLPWPAGTYDELKYFKGWTTGGVVLMGRKTWDSLPVKPLPNRINMVVSYSVPTLAGAIVNSSLGEALFEAGLAGVEEIFVIGGAEIFRQLFACGMDLVDEVRLTEVFDDWGGDTYFPVEYLKEFDEEIIVTTFAYQIKKYTRKN